MINVTDAIKKAYEKSTTQYDKIILDNEEYYINNVQYCDDCYLDGNIFGTAIARTLDFEIENIVDLEKKEFEYLTGAKTENGIEWISLGNFITQEAEPDELGKIVTVSAMDYMLKSNVEYKTELNYGSGTVTILQVLQEACTQAGLILATTVFANAGFIVDSNQFSEGSLIRQVFQAVAQISGTFAKIRSDNKLYFITPKRTSLTVREVHTMKVKDLNKLKVAKLVGCKNKIRPSDYSELTLKRNTHPINLVSLGMSDVEGENVVLKDEESIEEDGENSLVINDNPFAYTQAKRKQLITALFNVVKGFKYTSFEIVGQSKPYYETGDEVIVVDTDGTYCYSFLFRFNYKSRNGLESEMSAPSIIKATVNYQNVLEAIDIAKRTELKVDKQEQTIVGIIEQQAENTTKLTEAEQTIEGFKFEISQTGGNNFIKNSVGAYELDYWSITDNSKIEAISDTEVYRKSISKYAFKLDEGTMNQEVTLEQDKYYTISLKVKKDKYRDGYIKIKTALETIEINLDNLELDFQEIEKTFYVNTSNIDIEIHSEKANTTSEENSCKIIITDLMLNVGTSKNTWNVAAGEVLLTGVKINEDGIITYNNLENKKVILSQNGLDGYYKNKLVFTLNKETTETEKALTQKLQLGEHVEAIAVSNGVDIIYID